MGENIPKWTWWILFPLLIIALCLVEKYGIVPFILIGAAILSIAYAIVDRKKDKPIDTQKNKL